MHPRPDRLRVVNMLDLVLIGLLLIAVAGGYRLGLVARVTSWIGLAVGVVLSIWTVPYTLGLVEGGDAGLRLFVAVLVLLLTVTVCATLFQALGARARQSIARSPLSGVDRAAGAVAGGVAILAVVWFLYPAAFDVHGAVAREARGSTVVAAVRELGPAPPASAELVRSLVDTTRFPEVFADLQPPPVEGPPPSTVVLPDEVVARATASTVSVSSRGCGRGYDGSGFAVAEDQVVTNAHVVAGADEVVVIRPDGTTRPAEVVIFDPERDLAILAVEGLGQQPLELADHQVGTDGATIGYPGGQREPRVAAARIDRRQAARGLDIYSERETTRSVLFLAAMLRQGDSGSPLLDAQGRVGGVVFAISPDRDDVAYALDQQELRAVLDQPLDPGNSGRCI